MAAFVRSLIYSQLDWMGHLSAQAKIQLDDVETRCGRGDADLSARGATAVLHLRRLTVAMDERCSELRKLVRENVEHPVGAEPLLKEPIRIAHTALNSLLSEEPLPPIPIDQLEYSVRRLFVEIQPTSRETRRRSRI